MKNFVKEADVIDFVAAADQDSGDVVAVGSIIGVCVTDVLTGETGPLRIAGEFLLPTEAGQTIAQGDTLNLVAASGTMTKVTADLDGCATATVAAAAGEPVRCVINVPGA